MESFVVGNRAPLVHPLLRLCSCLLLILSASSGVWAQDASAPQDETPAEDVPIDVIADQLSVGNQGQTIEASGNVQIRRADTTFEAESIKIDRARQELEASGSVSIDDPQYKLKASSMNMNLTDETGVIRDANVFIERGHLSLSGSRLEKYVGQVYTIEDGLFTTCLCESGRVPWRIGAREINLEKDGQGIVKDGTFYLFDVPVFYLPYAIFPLQTERSTGFLIPRFGSSTEDGFLYQQPFYWAIDKSNDATLSFTVESSSRIGAIGEYRTVLRQGTSAELAASYFNESWRTNRNVEDRFLADPVIPENRWNVFGTFRNRNESGWIAYSDVSLYSDDLFARELVDLFDLEFVDQRTVRTSRFSRSRAAFYRHWANEASAMHVAGRWAYYQDFIQPQANVLQSTPRLSFAGRMRMGDTPFEFGWRVAGVSYLREGGTRVVNQGLPNEAVVEGTDGLRLDVRPEVVLPLKLGRYARWTARVALRETFYHLYYSGGKFDPKKNDFSGTFARNSSRELAEIRWNLASSIGRTFDWNGSTLEKIRHVLEPEIAYLFIPSTNQTDAPIWDELDRINRRNVLTFSLTNRFWGKRRAGKDDDPDATIRRSDLIRNLAETPQLGELARLKMALSFDIDKARRGADSLSDLDMAARLTPMDWFIMGANLGLDPGRWDVSQAEIGFSLSDPRPIVTRVADRDFQRPSQLSVSYRYIRRNFLSPLTEDANLELLAECNGVPADPQCAERDAVNQVRVNALFRLTDRLLVLYDSSFDGVSGRFTNNSGGFKYLSACECWTFTFAVNKLVNPSRTNVNVRFDLLGLGAPNEGDDRGILTP